MIALTAAMMVGEIIAGLAFGSMALLADGFHMATHAGALSIAALAYYYARRHARDERFSFGTGKLGELAGYMSVPGERAPDITFFVHLHLPPFRLPRTFAHPTRRLELNR